MQCGWRLSSKRVVRLGPAPPPLSCALPACCSLPWPHAADDGENVIVKALRPIKKGEASGAGRDAGRRGTSGQAGGRAPADVSSLEAAAHGCPVLPPRPQEITNHYQPGVIHRPDLSLYIYG